MFELVGQKKLIATLDSYTIDTLPKTILFVGEAGCGKRTFTTYLANRLKLAIVDLDGSCTEEDLFYYRTSPIPKIYRLDLRNINKKQQNKFLKFIEEPSETCFIVLLADSEISVLDTVLNRCIKLHFSQYTFDELKKLAAFFHPNFDEIAYQICRTPGKLVELDDSSISKLRKFCTSILNAPDNMSIGRTLGIYTYINCFENYDQYNFYSFINMLSFVSYTEYKDTNSQRALKLYFLTNRYLKILEKAPTVSKQDFLTNYLSVFFREVL